MVIDFQLVHNIIKKEIIEKFDHALTLNKNNVELIELAEKQKLKIYALDYHPTVENLVSLFAKLIQEKLPKENKLLKVQLRESDSNSVEWYSG